MSPRGPVAARGCVRHVRSWEKPPPHLLACRGVRSRLTVCGRWPTMAAHKLMRSPSYRDRHLTPDARRAEWDARG
jgi:hypothetical protein